MNERIKELKQQATLPGYMLGESYVQSRLDEQKFAELIIRECQDNLAWHGHDEAVSQLEWFKVNKLGIK